MDHGIHAEEKLEVICNSIFGPDIVARSPTLYERKGDRELADIVVECAETLLIFQSKSIKLSASDLDEKNAKRLDKRLTKARQQLATCLNAGSRNERVSYRNSVGIDLDIEWKNITRKIGIISIHISDQAYNSPEERFQLWKLCESWRGIEVHYFLLSDLSEASILLTTYKDFIHYLSIRQRSRALKALFANELDLLAAVKTQHDDIDSILNENHTESSLLIEPGTWETATSLESLRQKSAKNILESAPIEKIISMVFTSIEYSIQNGTHSPKDAANQYRTIVAALSKICRTGRREISRKILEKYKNTESKEHSYFLQVLEDENLAFLFLVTNYPKGSERLLLLQGLSGMAANHLKKVCPVQNILTIATEGARTAGLSIDFIYGPMDEMCASVETEPPLELFTRLKRDSTEEWEGEA